MIERIGFLNSKGRQVQCNHEIEPEKEIKDLIIQIMTASKHRGFRFGHNRTSTKKSGSIIIQIITRDK